MNFNEDNAMKNVLSKPCKELEALKEAIFNCPDINQAKINFIKEEITSGRYEIEPNHIARKLTEHYLYCELEPEPV